MHAVLERGVGVWTVSLPVGWIRGSELNSQSTRRSWKQPVDDRFIKAINRVATSMTLQDLLTMFHLLRIY